MHKDARYHFSRYIFTGSDTVRDVYFAALCLFINQFSHIAIWGSIGLWVVFFSIYSSLWPLIPLAPDMSGEVNTNITHSHTAAPSSSIELSIDFVCLFNTSHTVYTVYVPHGHTAPQYYFSKRCWWETSELNLTQVCVRRARGG